MPLRSMCTYPIVDYVASPNGNNLYRPPKGEAELQLLLTSSVTTCSLQDRRKSKHTSRIPTRNQQGSAGKYGRLGQTSADQSFEMKQVDS